ncbi:MAG: sporulation protein YabP [Clostridia bacterium]|nr:sporulation protein YabP [Clostridia bacterium]MBR5428507.1 sporulation protein YabP [Clostridia bacterium]
MTVNERAAIPNSIVLEDRKKLTVEGVREIGAYDDASVSAETDLGMLTVRGAGLKIMKMSVDTGELFIEGEISEIAYTDAAQPESSFWSRVFR